MLILFDSKLMLVCQIAVGCYKLKIVVEQLNMLTETKLIDESYLERRGKYKALVAGGMSDKDAKEQIWPSTTAGILRQARERDELEKAMAPAVSLG